MVWDVEHAVDNVHHAVRGNVVLGGHLRLVARTVLLVAALAHVLQRVDEHPAGSAAPSSGARPEELDRVALERRCRSTRPLPDVCRLDGLAEHVVLKQLHQLVLVPGFEQVGQHAGGQRVEGLVGRREDGERACPRERVDEAGCRERRHEVERSGLAFGM